MLSVQGALPPSSLTLRLLPTKHLSGILPGEFFLLGCLPSVSAAGSDSAATQGVSPAPCSPVPGLTPEDEEWEGAPGPNTSRDTSEWKHTVLGGKTNRAQSMGVLRNEAPFPQPSCPRICHRVMPATQIARASPPTLRSQHAQHSHVLPADHQPRDKPFVGSPTSPTHSRLGQSKNQALPGPSDGAVSISEFLRVSRTKGLFIP